MVLEQLLDTNTVKQHSYLVLVLSFIYVFFAYIVAKLFFPEGESIALIFTLTLILLPSLNHIINSEEIIEKKGCNHFLKNHKVIFSVYLASFIGIFLGFLILSNYISFSYQLSFIEKLDFTTIVQPTVENLFGLITTNLTVMIICFILSLFYGAGAIFLIVLNASVFAVFLNHLGKKIVYLYFFIHLIPEVAGFLLAAISGAIISRALFVEKFCSKSFKNILRNSLIILLIATGLIIIGALLEIFVTARII